MAQQEPSHVDGRRYAWDSSLCHVHKLALFKEARPIAQKKRKMGKEKRKAIEEEVNKLTEAGLVR